jgi:hypothetical protein
MLKGDPWLAICKNTAYEAGRLPVLRHGQGQHDGGWVCKQKDPSLGVRFATKARVPKSLAQNNNKNNTLGG